MSDVSPLSRISGLSFDSTLLSSFLFLFLFFYQSFHSFCLIVFCLLALSSKLFPENSSIFFRSGELRTQKLKSHLVRAQSLNVLPLKPGVSQYIAIHTTLTAMKFFLAYFYPSGPFTCIFFKTSPFFSCWLWLTPVPVQAPRIKQVTLLNEGSRVECPRNINRLKEHDLRYDDL